jgi:beta-1,4-mannosyltransferase
VFLPMWAEGNPYQNLLARHLEADGVEVIGGNGSSGWLLGPALGRWRADVLHFHWVSSLFDRTSLWVTTLRMLAVVGQILLLRILGKRVVWTVHNIVSHESNHRRLTTFGCALVARSVHVIFVHCESAREIVAARYRLSDTEKIVVIPHGHYIDSYSNEVARPAARSALGIEDSGWVVLFLGGVRPHKGVLELIDAFRSLEDPCARLIIAGRPLNQSEDALVRNASADDPRIRYESGFVADDRIQLYYNACDLAVFPYRDALTSGAMVLAMGFGVPCIAPRVGCLPDCIGSDGGFIYEPDDPNGLNNALHSALERRDELPGMGAANRRRAEGWDWQGIAARTFASYRGSSSGDRV